MRIMNKAPAFQFYASDFLADVAGWTAEEVGVYVRLLASEWVNGSVPPLPERGSTAGAGQAVNRLALIAGVSVAQLRRVWPQVGKKFEIGEDGFLRNPRLELERQKQVDYRSERSKAGAAGAEKRWTGQRSPSDSNGSANGSAIVLPLANGMAKNSSSSSSSSSSSVFVCEKEKAVLTHEEEQQNAAQIFQQIKSTPEGKALAERLGC